MADIKTRDVTRGHIKTLDRAASSMAGYDKTISNCGIISHIACQAGADNVHIIDYERYVNGEKDYEVSGL